MTGLNSARYSDSENFNGANRGDCSKKVNHEMPAERFPELPRELLRMFEDAKRLAYEYYADSNYSLMVDARMLFEQQNAAFGADPWPNGFARNCKNLEQFIGYSRDQRLISSPISAASLFHPSTHDT